MPARVSGVSQPAIDYTLNLLGLRVSERSCVLIAKSGWEWRPLGPARPLPIRIPRTTAEMDGADELCMTAFQYQLEYPGSDLTEVLGQKKPFAAALRTCSDPAYC